MKMRDLRFMVIVVGIFAIIVAFAGLLAKQHREVFYEDCDEVRASSAAPLHSGQPGYRPRLDDDGDGTACE